MAYHYNSLTGDIIVRKIQKKNKRNALLCILGLAAVAGLAVFLLYMTATEHKYLYAIGGLLLCALFVYVLITTMRKAISIWKDPSRARVFRKYGTPDQIAETIAAGADNVLLGSGKALITESFIMKHNDFESFIPFTDVLLCYRKESSTNGIPTAVYFVVHDVYGDSFEYPFKMGKKHKEEMVDIMKHISELAPQAAFGYSGQNLNYAKTHTKPLPQ
ncbi:MAG: hypothetical protein IK130_06405 [Oscillospiraceae bacterium]|nr:hypothetical protein [Oscillospiraceae bacterium]